MKTTGSVQYCSSPRPRSWSATCWHWFADDLREDLDLPFLPLPWTVDQLAPGFTISDTVRGWRTLIRTGHGSIGAAPDHTLSLVTLVPLSHLLLWPAAAVKASFLHEAGTPLLRDGGYAPAPA